MLMRTYVKIAAGFLQKTDYNQQLVWFKLGTIGEVTACHGKIDYRWTMVLANEIAG